MSFLAPDYPNQESSSSLHSLTVHIRTSSGRIPINVLGPIDVSKSRNRRLQQPYHSLGMHESRIQTVHICHNPAILAAVFFGVLTDNKTSLSTYSSQIYQKCLTLKEYRNHLRPSKSFWTPIAKTMAGGTLCILLPVIEGVSALQSG